MSDADLKDRGRLQKIWQDCWNTSKQCLRPGCNRSAIKSHWLQQQGILSNITANDGHLIQYSHGSAFSFCGFERKSAKKSAMLWFPGFCDKCDAEVFSPIEKNSPLFTDFKQQLLFSYRTMLNKLRKIEHLCDVNNKALLWNSQISLGWKKYIDTNKLLHIYKVKYLHYYKLLFDKEIYSTTKESVFSTAHISLPKVDIAATAMIHGRKMPVMTYAQLLKANPSIFAQPEFILNHIFVTLIPTASSLELILCWLTRSAAGFVNYPFLSSAHLAARSHREIFKQLSDMLIGDGDHWAMSDAFYAQLQAKGMDEKAIQLKIENMNKEDVGLPRDFKDFNLFEVVL
jgi:hypothetical protein